MSRLTAVDSRPGAGADAGPRLPQDHARSLRRRRGLPSGRAVVGGLLVIVAAVGVFAAYTDATALPETSWWVAKKDLAVGQRINPATDLEAVAITLPDLMARRMFDASRESLARAVAVAPIAAGELVEKSDVVRAPNGLVASEEISFSVGVDRAVAGTLQPGDRVDVLATYGSDIDGCTTAVVRRALVLRAPPPPADRLEGTSATLVLGLDRPEQSVAVADAVNNGKIVVVRTTAGASPSRAASGCYQPFPPDPVELEADS